MRISQNDLDRLVLTLNEITNNPINPWSKDKTDKLTANIGNYHIDCAYGGVALHKMCNEHGAINDIFGGHIPKKELWYQMRAYLLGIQNTKRGNE